MFFIQILRAIFCLLDNVVAFLIINIYELFMKITDVTLDPSVVTEFASRIYALLGIVMLFKLAFSFINYIANPDAFSDTAQGAKKTFGNVFVVLVLIIATPTIFDLAFEAQALVLRKNIIPKIIMGAQLNENSDEVSIADVKQKGGRQMAYIIYSSFFEVNNDLKGYTTEACSKVYAGLTSKDKWDNGRKCFNVIDMDDKGDVEEVYKRIVGHADDSDGVEDVYSFFEWDYYAATGENKYDKDGFIFSYIPLVPTLCAGFIAYVLLIFCIDIAVRAIKLAVLQLIAPVPIISYIDPKKGKEVFNKWTSTCLKTYLDVFIRLVTIFFVLYLIQLLTGLNDAAFVRRNYEVNQSTCVAEGGIWMSSDGGEYCGEKLGAFVVIFMILGLLKFAEEAPKLLQDLFGLNLDGKFSLNPRKAVGKYASGLTDRAIGGAAGSLSGSTNAYKAARESGDSGLRSALKAIGGGARGLGQGVKGAKGVKSIKEAAKNGLGAGRDVYNRMKAKEGTTGGGRRKAIAQKRLGMKTDAYKLKDRNTKLASFVDNASKFKSNSRDEVLKNKNGSYMAAAIAKADYERLQSNPSSTAVDIENARARMETELKAATETEMTRQLGAYNSGNYSEAPGADYIREMQAVYNENGSLFAKKDGSTTVDFSSGSAINDSKDNVTNLMGEINQKASEVRANDAYASAKIGEKK